MQALAKNTEGFSIRNIEAIFNNIIINVPMNDNKLTDKVIYDSLVTVRQSKENSEKQETEQSKRDSLENRRWNIEQLKYGLTTGMDIYQLYQQEKERQKNEWQWPLKKTGEHWYNWHFNAKCCTYESCQKYLTVAVPAMQGLAVIASIHPLGALAIGGGTVLTGLAVRFGQRKLEERDAEKEKAKSGKKWFWQK